MDRCPAAADDMCGCGFFVYTSGVAGWLEKGRSRGASRAQSMRPALQVCRRNDGLAIFLRAMFQAVRRGRGEGCATKRRRTTRTQRCCKRKRRRGALEYAGRLMRIGICGGWDMFL